MIGSKFGTGERTQQVNVMQPASRPWLTEIPSPGIEGVSRELHQFIHR
jgi:hypothetical protein